jgi:DNA anti-recombination protein RmuC
MEIPTSLYERIGAMDAKISAAHTRQDRMELEIKELLNELKSEMKDISAHVNKSKGWAAAALMMAGILGTGLGVLLKIIFK